jgi:MFS family permease
MPAVSSLSALLLSVLFLISGNGLLNTLVPLRGKLDGFPESAIGLIGSAYFFGMLLGTFFAPAIIRRAGAVQAFAAFAAATVVAALVFPALPQWTAWIGLRAVIGFAFAGLYAVIEAWLNARSDNTNRGRVYALYQIVTFTGSACGQEVIGTVNPRAELLFSLAAAAIVAAVIPLTLTKTTPPRAPRTVALRIGWLARLCPVGAVAALCIGAANGSFYSLAPVFGLGLGMSPGAAAGFMTAATLGTALAVYPVARLSDGHDRRVVLLVFAAIGILAEVMLVLRGTASPTLLLALGFAIGASTMVLYTIAISHTNDRAGPENAIEVSAGMLFLYCVGAIIMPVVGSMLMAKFGPAALFAQNAAVHGVLVGFVLWRLFTDVPGFARSVPQLTARAGLG